MKLPYLRSPKTTQECRKEQDSLENGIKVRPKRNRRNLPNAWDDIVVRRPKYKK